MGTLVEINLHRQFGFEDGDVTDYRIAGIEVDCKYPSLPRQYRGPNSHDPRAPAGSRRHATMASSRLIRWTGGWRPSSARAARARRTTVSAAPRPPCPRSVVAGRR